MSNAVDKAKLIRTVKQKLELGFESDLWNCPDNEPGLMPFTIAALVLCECDLKKVPAKVIELLEKSIEHDLLMSQAMQVSNKPNFIKRLIFWTR